MKLLDVVNVGINEIGVDVEYKGKIYRGCITEYDGKDEAEK